MLICLQSATLPGASISLHRQVASLQMSVWMPLLICPWQAASCPSLMEGDSHKRSCYEANRNLSFLNKRGHGSEPQPGVTAAVQSWAGTAPPLRKGQFTFSSRVKGETGKWRRRRHKQQPNKIFFQELLKQGRLWERRQGPASHFQQGKQAGELVKGMFFFFFWEFTANW